MNPKKKLKRKYNILRHMGSIYSLNMMEEFKPGSVNMDNLKRTVKYIMDSTFEPFKEDMIGIWSDEKFSGKKGAKRQIKLGSAGLTLVALSPLLKKFPDIITLDTLKKIGNLIIYMQKENGSFYSKYYEDSGFDTKWVSLYYPGEAIFGLIELYRVSQEQKYLDAAYKGILYLEESRRSLKVSKMLPDHWALIASSKVLKYGNPTTEQKDRIISHARKVVKLMLSQQIRISPFQNLIGGFSARGNTTPTSTRVEGLNAIYPFLKEEKLKQQTYIGIQEAVKFLRLHQLVEPPFTGAWRRSTFKYDLDSYAKEYGHNDTYHDYEHHNGRVDEIRIDYVQHGLSALIGFTQIRTK